MEAIDWRGLERLIIIIGAIFFVYLGYKLYKFGLSEGVSKLKFESKFLNLALSGVGPGLFFIGLASLTLFLALIKGGAESSTYGSTLNDIVEQRPISSETITYQMAREEAPNNVLLPLKIKLEEIEAAFPMVKSELLIVAPQQAMIRMEAQKLYEKSIGPPHRDPPSLEQIAP